MKKKIKSKSKNNFFIPFCLAIFVCLAGAALNSFLFYNSFFRALTKMNETPIATITFKYKTAQRKFLDRVVWDRLRQNSPVYNGDTIHTANLSEATIWFSDGNIMELSENTMAQVFLSEDKSLKAELSDGFATIDSSLSEQGMTLASKGVEVAVQSGSALSAGAVTALEKTLESGTESAFSGDTSSTKGEGISSENSAKRAEKTGAASGTGGLSIQVIKGSVEVQQSDGKTISMQQGEGIQIEGTEQKKPALIVTQPAPQSKILYHTKDDMRIPFSWTLSDVPENAITSIIIAVDKNFSDKKYQSIATGTDSAQIPLAPGTYYWKITIAKDNKSEPLAEQTGKIQIIQSLPPELVAPAEEYSYSYRTRNPAVRLIWTESLYATSYKMEIADNPQMNNPIVEQRSSLTSSIISTLSEGTYWWRVTPYYTINRTGFASPSKTRSFSIEKKGTLPKPSVYIPQNNGIINTEDTGKGISFSWKQESEASLYTLKIADNPNLTGAKIVQETHDNFCTLNSDAKKLTDGKWYWAVTLQDIEGNVSEQSEVRTFFAMKGKPEQHVIEPADNFKASQALMPDTRFTWKRNLPENFVSRMQISSDISFSRLLYDSSVTGTSAKGINLPEGTYYWRLKSNSTTDEAELITPVRMLQVVGNLDAPVLNEPKERAVARETVPYTFSWEEVLDADYYKFSIFRLKDNELVHEETVFGTETTVDMFTNPKFKDKTMYKWQVQAFANAIPGIQSRRTGSLSENDFYLVKLRPVEITVPSRNAQIKGADAVISPITAHWSTVDKVKKAQFVLTKTDVNPPLEIMRIPSDIQMSNGNTVAPQNILLDTPDGLRPGTYEIIVYAETLDGINISNTDKNNRGTFTVLPVEPLDTAQNLVSTPQIFNTEYLRNPQNPKTITLSWNKVPKATDYYVSVLNRRGKEILSYNVKKGTSYTIDFKLLSEEDKIAFSKGTFYWTVKGVRRIDTDKDGNIDKILQESPEAKSSFETDIPTPKKSKAKGASNPYGN